MTSTEHSNQPSCHKCKDTGRGYRAFYSNHQMICDCPVGEYELAWTLCTDEQHEASILRSVEVTMSARKAERHARRDARRAVR